MIWVCLFSSLPSYRKHGTSSIQRSFSDDKDWQIQHLSCNYEGSNFVIWNAYCGVLLKCESRCFDMPVFFLHYIHMAPFFRSFRLISTHVFFYFFFAFFKGHKSFIYSVSIYLSHDCDNYVCSSLFSLTDSRIISFSRQPECLERIRSVFLYS